MSQLTDDERKEALEHRDAILDVRAILATSSGKRFLKYLFKHQEVAQLPDLGLEGSFLHDRLGSLRPGRLLFELVCEANAELAGTLLAEIEKERYAELYKQAEIGQN